MACCQRDELVGATIEEWIVAYDECTNPLLDKARKGSVDLAFRMQALRQRGFAAR